MHNAMHPDVAVILSDKRALVFAELLEEVTFLNRSDLLHFFSSGFPVVGAYPRTEVFPAF